MQDMPELFVTYITSCKGRLAHLRQTLPRVVSQPGVHCVVVDYDCPDGTARWVEENCPSVEVVKFSNTPGFSIAKARNAGAAVAKTEWLAFFDADILVEQDFFARLRPVLQSGSFYRVSPVTMDTWGSVICRREAFERAEGYDTVYQGWGVEDDDLYDTLEFIGLKHRRFDGSAVAAIPHDDAMRTRFHDVSRRVSHQCNQIYRHTKLDLMRMNRSLMPRDLRESMYEQIRSKALQQHQLSSSGLEFDVVLPPIRIDAPDVSRTLGKRPQTRMARRVTYSVTWDDLKAE